MLLNSHVANFAVRWENLILWWTKFSISSLLLAFALYIMSGLGITAGAHRYFHENSGLFHCSYTWIIFHRLWAHKSYKAKWPLRALLVLFNTIAFQVIYWKISKSMIFWFFHFKIFIPSESHLRMGQRPQSTSQVLRDWRRSTQCYQRLLLRPCWMASLQKTSWCHEERKNGRHEWSVGRSIYSFPKKVSAALNLALKNWIKFDF